MSTSDYVVVAPDDLQRLADRYRHLTDDLRTTAHRILRRTTAVRFNGNDDGYHLVDFSVRHSLVETRLRTAAEGYNVDGDLMARTVAESLVTDRVTAAAVIDDLSTQIADWPGTDNDPLLDDLTCRRRSLIAGLFAGSSSASGVMHRFLDNDGSLSELFDLVEQGDNAIGDRVHYLINSATSQDARLLDEAAAVAQLVADDSPGVDHYRRLATFEARVEHGVDVTVAANTVRLGIAIPTATELESLVDSLTNWFADHRWQQMGLAPPSAALLAWLPFGLRAGLSRPSKMSKSAAGAPRHRDPYGFAFSGGPDNDTTRARIVGELGRAGLDPTGGRLLGQELVELATVGGPSLDLRVQQQVADVVADESTGLSGFFFATLGATGAADLTGTAMTAFHPSTDPDRSGTAARMAVVATYGDGLADLDRRGGLSFSAEELFAETGLHSPAYLMSGQHPFSRDFVLSAASAVLTEQAPGISGGSDPRAIVISEVSKFGPAAGLELFDRLGDGFLDRLLWIDSPIRSTGAMGPHPVYDLFAPILDDPELRPVLSKEIVENAILDHDGIPPAATAEVIEHALLTDLALLAPTDSSRLPQLRRGPVDPIGPPELAGLVERVFHGGSGDGLRLYVDTVVPMMVTTAYNGGHLSAVPRRALRDNGEIVGIVAAAEANTRFTGARAADARAEVVKRYGSSVVTAFAGLALPATPAAAVGAGAITSAGTAHLFDALATDRWESELISEIHHQNAESSVIRRQVATTLRRLEAIEPLPTKISPLDQSETPVRVADGGFVNDLGAWQDYFGSLEAEAAESYRLALTPEG